jgi:hypothetical protein
MLIDDIVAKIDEGGPSSYYSFEVFILNLLKHHLSIQHKTLVVNHGQSFIGDAIAPDGIDEIEGPVLFEIKFNLGRYPKKLQDDLLPRFFKSIKDSSSVPPKNIIVIR